MGKIRLGPEREIPSRKNGRVNLQGTGLLSKVFGGANRRLTQI